MGHYCPARYCTLPSSRQCKASVHVNCTQLALLILHRHVRMPGEQRQHNFLPQVGLKGNTSNFSTGQATAPPCFSSQDSHHKTGLTADGRPAFGIFYPGTAAYRTRSPARRQPYATCVTAYYRFSLTLHPYTPPPCPSPPPPPPRAATHSCPFTLQPDGKLQLCSGRGTTDTCPHGTCTCAPPYAPPPNWVMTPGDTHLAAEAVSAPRTKAYQDLTPGAQSAAAPRSPLRLPVYPFLSCWLQRLHPSAAPPYHQARKLCSPVHP